MSEGLYSAGQGLRHIGRNTKNNARVAVVWKQLPEDPMHALVVYIDSLPTVDREEVLILLNSSDGQKEDDFAVSLFKRQNLLDHFHKQGHMKRVHIDEIDMMLYPNHPIPLRTVIDSISLQTGKTSLAEVEKLSSNTLVTGVAKVIGESVANDIPTVVHSFSPEMISLDDEKPKTAKLTADEKKSIAKGLMIQAKLLEEDMSKKLKEAYKLDPTLKPKTKTTK